jgi:hypothetical protein
MAASGIGLAMKYFGRSKDQTLAEFRDEWNTLTDNDKAQLTKGLSDESLTY